MRTKTIANNKYTMPTSRRWFNIIGLHVFCTIQYTEIDRQIIPVATESHSITRNILFSVIISCISFNPFCKFIVPKR
jgi:hypothetical protein